MGLHPHFEIEECSRDDVSETMELHLKSLIEQQEMKISNSNRAHSAIHSSILSSLRNDYHTSNNIPKRSQTHFKKNFEAEEGDDSSEPLDENSVYQVMIPCNLSYPTNTPVLKPNLVPKADHYVTILNEEFSPSFLKVYRGDIVQWTVSQKNHRDPALQYFANRQHVLSFDNLAAESHLLH